MRRWAESLLVPIAVMAVTWPLAWFTTDASWRWPSAAVLAAMALTGATLRSLRRPRWQTIAIQTAVMLAGIAVVASRLVDDLPPDVERPGVWGVRHAVELVAGGIETIQTYAVPAPVTPGLLFVVLAGIVVLAWCVETVALTLRRPVLGALPLLAVAVATASNTGRPLAPWYFLITAAAWLGVLALQNLERVHHWLGTPTGAQPIDPTGVRTGVRQHLNLAQHTAAVALVAALALPWALPHLPPAALVGGFGGVGSERSGSASGSGSVRFTDTLDVAADLADRSDAPVIRYSSELAAPPPLRVLTTSSYADGQWRPDAVSQLSDALPPEPEGLGEDVPLRDGRITVMENNVAAPQLAVPPLAVAIDLGRTSWAYDLAIDAVSVDGAVDDYEVDYAQIDVRETLPAGVGDPGSDPDRPRFDDAVLDVDPVSELMVRDLADQIVGDATNQIEIAQALQGFFRGPTFTYSLTLAPPVQESGEPLDPISHFLVTRQGYCTQFATAMVMMARSQGIPARLALGFLPGEPQDDGSWTVVASNAHAWPELYIDGLGWTRFEPTPAEQAGAAPAYPIPQSDSDVAETPETQAPEEVPEDDPDVSDAASDDDSGSGATDSSTALWTALGRALLVVAALALLLTVAPAIGWWYRSGPRRRARTSAERIEAHWHALVAGLRDLGVGAPGAITPRQAHAHYVAALGGDDPVVTTTLARITGALEDTRYAAGGGDEAGVAEAVQTVLRRHRRTLGRARRLRVALLPRSAWPIGRSIPGTGASDRQEPPSSTMSPLRVEATG